MTREHHRIHELDEDACRDLIAKDTARIGRVAFAEDRDPDWPTVLPVNYAFVDGVIYFRTFEGSKLYAALRHLRVAFEVDRVDETWREGWSVVVRGALEIVRDPEVIADVEISLASWAAGENEQLVALRAEQITGRRVFGPSTG